ncbi:urate hydroxylase PuuD [Pseudooceanicola sp. CBS1P-1]|uniref:Cysteine desulfurase n=1 Tax=Pseudooceanicola albus TaxID=2692189 RepID=A0A6L7G6S1_9RHOB|nr:MULTISPECIES: urate hydroxylase PuuD [Pseudooceanicola]MBT9384140.1 urate hydroxylase PuuD [Pseudooceanicola endophyticus]MXN19761.1 cysteine desulfurase [Pseudooceanicola albus]
MYDWAALGAWIEFAVRWLHVITAIAWIGSSFYFIALDLGLHRDRNLASGADGEEWQVHGGGFYHVQKYLVAPAQMPDDLIWYKWEAYSTWLSGFALLCLVYYMGADFYLVDPAVLDIPTGWAIVISICSLAFGWLVYDRLCKSKFGDDNTRLMLGLYVLLVCLAYFYTHVFSGRAALLHLGAFTATIMSANVFMIIMPNQRVVVADLKAGRKPDAKYGKIAKQRSTHNNYLTLPVIFMMLSNHYPLAFSTQYTWIIASLVFLMGVTIRHFFNSMHSRQGMPYWTWLVTALIFILIAWLSTAPLFFHKDQEQVSENLKHFTEAPGYTEVHDIVMGRCSMCHAKEPGYDGILWAPKGVRLDTDAQIARNARMIYLEAGLSHAMPPANVSFMEDAERKKIRDWYAAATKG